MHIVFAGNHRFVPYLGVAIYSILKHASSKQTIRFSILGNGLLQSDRRKLEGLCRGKDAGIEFVEVDACRFADAPLNRFASHEPYFRLLIPDLFPESKRALYLDGDILVCDDLCTLFESDLKGQPLGACDDVSATKHMERMGLSRYFNSGVLLMDLEIWRREQLFAKLMQALRERREDLKYEDQDLLNVQFADRFTPLDLRWNVFSIFFSKSIDTSFFSPVELNSVLENPGILHFAGKFKPYFIENHPLLRKMYYQDARMTPFSDQLLWRGLRMNLSHFRWKIFRHFGKGDRS